MCINFVEGNNDAEEESDEDEDYVPSEDWKKVCETFICQFQTLCCQITAGFVLQKHLHTTNKKIR